MLVNILYSTPPDGDDASLTYATRASELCTCQDGVTLGYVGQLAVNDDGGADLPWRIGDNNMHTTENVHQVLTIFLVSCSADGSVNRNVRKIMRKLPKHGDAANSVSKCHSGVAEVNCPRYYAIAALGHARCENSANQMAEIIFGTARRVDKLLAGSGFFDIGPAPHFSRLETQVELCGPEKEFDPWLKRLMNPVVERN
mmetsp:Transcript_22579/g.48876  ORF Transcript_22579/g.48876 Transcript_22579/m.48876 type:complete len:199 (+) Transcript_22579:137-733(+)